MGLEVYNRAASSGRGGTRKQITLDGLLWATVSWDSVEDFREARKTRNKTSEGGSVAASAAEGVDSEAGDQADGGDDPLLGGFGFGRQDSGEGEGERPYRDIRSLQ